MSDPQTVNVALAIPTRGSDIGTWDLPVNGDFTALDGFLGGVQTISASASPIILTVPAGFTATPGAGPTQAQNAVLRFTGTLTSNVRVTLPMPGPMIIENLTTGNFVLSFQGVTPTQVVGIDQGEIVRIYNDGANVRFIDFGRIGHIEMWAGLSAIPAWVSACTVPPFLLCDGGVYNFSVYPYLGARLGSAFGGNGTTTFGVPDLRGRVPLPYDGTGTRITAAGCGINGQTLGASQDKQTNTLLNGNLPPYTPAGSVASQINYGGGLQSGGAIVTPGTNVGVGGAATGGTTLALNGNLLVGSTFSGTAQGGTSIPVNNVQPAQVTGIPVIRAA